jgi:hypothetical protein
MVWGSDFRFCYKGNESSKFQHCSPMNLDDPEIPIPFSDVQSRKVDIPSAAPLQARQQISDSAIEKYKQGLIVTPIRNFLRSFSFLPQRLASPSRCSCRTKTNGKIHERPTANARLPARAVPLPMQAMVGKAF